MRPRILELIASLSGFSGLDFNPAVFVDVVNNLLASGFESATQTLSRYVRLSRDSDWPQENALLAARGLFIPAREGEQLPRLALGAPDVEEPRDPAVFPLFPLHMRLDLPLLLVGGYRLGGEALPPQVYLDWCEARGALRPARLSPPDDPLASVDTFLRTDRWTALKPAPWHYQMLRLEALRAVSNVYQIGVRDRQAALASLNEETWARHRDAVRDLSVRWNEEVNRYESVPETAR